MSRLLFLIALLLTVGCSGSTREVVRVVNQSPDPVQVRLEERHPAYATHVSEVGMLGPGQALELWWEPEFQSSVVIRDAKGEIGRRDLAPGVRNFTHR